MLAGFIILVCVPLAAAFIHRRSRFEEKIIKNVPLSEWVGFLVLPTLMYFGLVIVIRNTLVRPTIGILPFEDIDLLFVLFLLMLLTYGAVSLHFGAKVLWKYLKKHPHSIEYRVNEMFHGKLTHYMGFMVGLLIIYMVPVLEMNHPLSSALPVYGFRWILGAGILFGISACKMIFYTNEWYGGYNRPLFLFTLGLLLLLLIVFRMYGLEYRYYPLTLFVHTLYASIIGTMVIRQGFIFSRLGKRKRLTFLARMLSVHRM